MKLYTIYDDYVQFLYQYDHNVALNKSESRPYVGVVIEVDNIKYYAPLTSPKPKHRKMRDGKDFRKIHNGDYGAINFNNMIPVPDDALMLIDIDGIPDAKYKNLLINQISAIEEDADNIIKTAANLRTLVMKNDYELTSFDRNVKSRCCNLTLLEAVYKRLQSANNVRKQEPEEVECVFEENNGNGRGR